MDRGSAAFVWCFIKEHVKKQPLGALQERMGLLSPKAAPEPGTALIWAGPWASGASLLQNATESLRSQMTPVKFFKECCKRTPEINICWLGLLSTLVRGEAQPDSSPGEMIRIFTSPKPPIPRRGGPLTNIQARKPFSEDSPAGGWGLQLPTSLRGIPSFLLGPALFSVLTAKVELLQLKPEFREGLTPQDRD